MAVNIGNAKPDRKIYICQSGNEDPVAFIAASPRDSANTAMTTAVIAKRLL
jgi:hypothetical protein